MRAYRVRDTHALMISELESGFYTVKGDLTFATINQNVTKMISFTRKNQTFQIDLADAANIDSAGLALLIEWLKLGKKYSCNVIYTNLPAQLKALAKMSGIDQNLHLTLQTENQSISTTYHG